MTGALFCQSGGNVVPIRRTPPRQAFTAPIEPPDPAEINAARLYVTGDFTAEMLVRCCGGSQIRAGRALDTYFGRRAR